MNIPTVPTLRSNRQNSDKHPPQVKSSSKKKKSDDLTVVFLKDNLESRSFRFPLKWLDQVGFLLLIMAGVTLLSIAVAVKYYRTSELSGAFRVSELLDELQDIRTSYHDLKEEAGLAPKTTLIEKTISAIISGTTPNSDRIQERALEDLKENDVEDSSEQNTTANQIEPPLTHTWALTAFPQSTLDVKERKLKFDLTKPKISESPQGGIKVDFAIQYTSSDGEVQKGFIAVLLKGANTFKAYPETLLNPIGASSFFNPNQGESFSVSRYREVAAEFPWAANESKPTEIVIFVFDRNGKLLHNEVHSTVKALSKD